MTKRFAFAFCLVLALVLQTSMETKVICGLATAFVCVVTSIVWIKAKRSKHKPQHEHKHEIETENVKALETQRGNHKRVTITDIKEENEFVDRSPMVLTPEYVFFFPL